MANTIKLKSGSGNNPSASDLVVGEVALRTDGNPKLFTKNDAGNVLEVGLVESGSITSTQILNGTIVNADINASAAIAGTKISPDFGSQTVTTTGTVNTGLINASSASDQILNLNSSDNGAVYLAFKRSGGRKAYIGYGGTGSTLNIVNEINDGDITIAGSDGGSQINLLTFNTSENGRATFVGNVNVGAGIDVTGNITVTGTVDGVDIAALNTTVGNLSLSGSVLADGTTATTQSASDNSTKVATTAYTDTAISNLVSSAPSTLDTLKELSDALGSDPNFATTVTNSIATKLPLAGGTLTGDLTISTTAPLIKFDETDQTTDYFIVANNNTLTLARNNLNAPNHIQKWNADGHVDFLTNVDFASGIDVTGAITTTGDLTLSGTSPQIFLTDTDSRNYEIGNNGGVLRIRDVTNGVNRIEIDYSGNVDISGNLDVGAGLDVTGTLDVDGRLDVNGDYAYLQSNSSANSSITFRKSDSNADSIDYIQCRDSSNNLKFKIGGSGNAQFASNIVVSGTVDGRDLAADGSKLDGIESGATADQTKSDIDALGINAAVSERITLTNQGGDSSCNVLFSQSATGNHLPHTNANLTFNSLNGTLTATTFSGSGASLTNIPAGQLTGTLPALDGSNLTGLTVNNANTLDNLDSTQFLRSDTDDTASNYIHFSDNKGIRLSHGNQTSTNDGVISSGRFGSGLNIVGTQTVGGQGREVRIWGDVITNSGSKFWNAENDGSGSGLDADTLDGISSASFARSDIEETITGKFDFTSTGSYPLKISGSDDAKLYLKGASNPYIRFAEGTTDKAFIQWHSSGVLRIKNQEDGSVLDIQDSIRFSSDNGSSYNNVFHAGNDGSGSGLDADTVDGLEASSFLRSNTADNFTGTLTFTGGAGGVPVDFATNDGYASMRVIRNNTSNSARNDGLYIGFSNSNNGITRIYGGGATTGALTVNGASDVRINGSTVWNSGNDGSGSGLDADTLDGNQASAFPTLSGSNSFSNSYNEFGNSTGSVSNNGNWNGRLNLAGSQHARLDVQSVSDGIITTMYAHTNHSTGKVGTSSNHGLTLMCNSSSRAELSTGGTLTTHQQGTLWGSSNDGSGSGLDSDLLDGQEGSYYRNASNINAGTIAAARLGTASASEGGISVVGNFGQFQGHGTYTDFNTEPAYWGWNFVQGNTNAPNTISSQWYRCRLSLGSEYGKGSASGDYSLEMAIPRSSYSSAGGLHIRTIESGSEGSWHEVASKVGSNTVFHTGNDGAGSGLDADLLDGLSGGSFLRSDADDNCDARITFKNNLSDNDDDMATSTAYLGGLEVQNTGVGNDAFMAFHAGGDYACYFGLDADTNRLAIGGWSMGAVKYSVLHTNFASIRGSSAGQSYDIRFSMDGTRAAASVGHNATHHEGIFWHTSNNYGIYRTSGNWSGNYQQLRLDWPTGIVISGGTQYGLSHVRFESHLLPNVTDTRDLGSTSLRWRNIYTNDLNLSNEGGANDIDGTWGSFTIQEGEEDLFLINKRNGKKYKINMTEVS